MYVFILCVCVCECVCVCVGGCGWVSGTPMFLLMLCRRAQQSVSFSARPPSLGSVRASSGSMRAGLHGVQMKAGGDLLIVGAGTLGMRLIADYRDKYPDAKIVAMTNTTKRHEDLLALGAHPTTRLPSEKFQNVAYLATPNAADYVGLCAKCLDLWTGTAQEGSFILSSSVGVFSKKGVEEGTKITEEFATDSSSSNFTRDLCAAEEHVLLKGGSVMRIAGMYNLRKGRNSFFLKGGEVKRRGDAYIGLVGMYVYICPPAAGNDTPLYFTTPHLSSKNCCK